MTARVNHETEIAADGWRAGDAIPGWEDFDACYVDAGAIVVEKALDFVGISFMDSADNVEVPRGIGVDFRGETFTDSDGASGARGSYTRGDLRGQGWYPPPVEVNYPDRWNSSFLYTEFGRLSDGFDIPEACSADPWVCIERLRPDELTEYIIWEVPGGGYEGKLDWDPAWAPFQVVVPFHVYLPYVVSDGTTWSPETEAWRLGVVYDAESPAAYDEAWPWDLITDPSIRDVVYDRYRPVESTIEWDSPE